MAEKELATYTDKRSGRTFKIVWVSDYRVNWVNVVTGEKVFKQNIPSIDLCHGGATRLLKKWLREEAGVTV